MDHDVTCRMGAAKVHEIHAAVTQMHGHAVVEGGGGVGEAWDAFMPLEQAREPLELGVPVLLSALHHHAARGFSHDDLVRAIGRGPQHAHGVIMRQHHMADRFVCNAADLFDDLVCQTRRCLRLNYHNGVVADDHAGVGVSLGGEGPQVAPDLVEGYFLLGHVALGGKCFGHGFVLTSVVLRGVGGMGCEKGRKLRSGAVSGEFDGGFHGAGAGAEADQVAIPFRSTMQREGIAVLDEAAGLATADVYRLLAAPAEFQQAAALVFFCARNGA